jgi:hypothetical protein
MWRMKTAGVIAVAALLLSGETLQGTSLSPTAASVSRRATNVSAYSVNVFVSTRDSCAECSSMRSGETAFGTWHGYIEWGGECGQASSCIPCEESCEGDFESDAFDDEASAGIWGQAMCSCPETSPFAVVPSLVQSEDADEIAALIQRSRGKVFINESRAAVQGKGCGEEIAFHLNVSAALLQAIAGRANALSAQPTGHSR